MAVVNRTLDASEQRKVISNTITSTSFLINGVTNMIGLVPFNGVIDTGMLAVEGVSGSPAYSLKVARFIAGTGFTVIVVGSSNLPVAIGTSGPIGLSLPASGSTLNNVLANDVLLLHALGGTGAAAEKLTVSVVVRPVQDIKTHFGV